MTQIRESGVHVRAVALLGNVKEELSWRIKQLRPDFVLMAHKDLNSERLAFHDSVALFLARELFVPLIVARKSHN